MNAIILHKERQPVASHTPETLEAAGRKALADDMRAKKIASEHEYIVGRHGYFVTVYESGCITQPKRIF